MDYQSALQYILGFTDYERETRYAYSPVNFDLRRVEALLARLGNPHLAAKTVHIAGTKGKGSTAAMIQSMLREAGFRVGLFTSPHLLSFRERIRVNGDLIPEERMAGIVERMKPEIEAVLAEEEVFGRLTTFELIAGLAFVHFGQEAVEFQVIEAGLGGRLDATNVVRPLVAVITAISLDHTAILGDTIRKIAIEKSGIVKPGSTVVMAPQDPEAEEVIAAACREKGARLLAVGMDLTWRAGEKRPDGMGMTVSVGSTGGSRRGDRPVDPTSYDLWVPLIGDHQQENAATAVAVVKALQETGAVIPPPAFAKGIAKTSWPGRLQIVETRNGRPFVVVDGAHNGDSARRLRLAVEEYFSFDRVILIIGTSSDKDLPGIAGELSPLVSKAVVTRSAHPRSADLSALAPLFSTQGVETLMAEDVRLALTTAKKIAGPNDLVLATGSLFIVAEVLEAYGVGV